VSTTLTRIADGLYAPESGELLAFLLADPAGAPDAFPLEETWSDAGPARRIGTHVSLLSPTRRMVRSHEHPHRRRLRGGSRGQDQPHGT